MEIESLKSMNNSGSKNSFVAVLDVSLIVSVCGMHVLWLKACSDLRSETSTFYETCRRGARMSLVLAKPKRPEPDLVAQFHMKCMKEQICEFSLITRILRDVPRIPLENLRDSKCGFDCKCLKCRYFLIRVLNP